MQLLIENVYTSLVIRKKTNLFFNLFYMILNFLFRNSKTEYNPIFFLAALWPGWMAVSFFMYLMFIIPRNSEKFAIPVFETIKEQFFSGNNFYQIVIFVALFWILFFSFFHFKMLIWNLKKYFDFKKSNNYEWFINWKNEISLIAIPLTLAMSINVIFILWAVFIPHLWSIVEYLFPFALLWFFLVWALTLKIFMHYFTKILLKKWWVDLVNTNSLNQMLSVFSLVMVWVWFAASAAMSNIKLTIFFWLFWSISFVTIALILMFIKMILWFRAMFEHWIDKATSPSIWIIIPILTLIWITIIRDSHWLHDFWLHTTNSFYLLVTVIIFAIQLFFGILGYGIMKQNWYFDDYINWKEKNPWSYALICPWVAIVVFWFFFVHLGLVKTWIVDKYSLIYYISLVPILYIQIKTIQVLFKLNNKLV